MKRLVIYHADCADGFTAAWVLWRKFGYSDTEYMPAHYGDKPPDVAGKEVRIVDFSYPREVLERMHAEAESLQVIDHHKTAQDALQGLPYAHFDMNKSGAGLTWDLTFPGRARPALVNYVEDRDLWKWELPDSHAVNAYLATRPRTFEVWHALYNFAGWDLPELVDLGKACLGVVDQYVERSAPKARRMCIGGVWVPAINTTYAISELVGTLARDEPFACGWFQAEDGTFKYSLRSREGGVDVSEIAKQYGGGGHRQAAGFSSEYLFKTEAAGADLTDT